MYPVACRAHDRAIFDPKWTVARRPAGQSQHALGQGLHDGGTVQGRGYATAIFGKWHLGEEPQSLPTAHGFDEFYGIAPDSSWDDPVDCRADHADALHQCARERPRREGTVDRAAEGRWTAAAREPFTPEVRAEIDNELTDQSIAFIKQQHAAASRSSSTCPSRWATCRITHPSSSTANRASVTMATR